MVIFHSYVKLPEGTVCKPHLSCLVLYCMVLYRIVLCCIVLFCIVWRRRQPARQSRSSDASPARDRNGISSSTEVLQTRSRCPSPCACCPTPRCSYILKPPCLGGGTWGLRWEKFEGFHEMGWNFGKCRENIGNILKHVGHMLKCVGKMLDSHLIHGMRLVFLLAIGWIWSNIQASTARGFGLPTPEMVVE